MVLHVISATCTCMELFSHFRLINLQFMSIDNNQLTELPVELCALSRLEEFHAANNQLTGLPLEFGFLISLTKLHLQKNRIRELPEVEYDSVSGIDLTPYQEILSFNSLPHYPEFKQPWGRGFLKTLWEKEKMLVTSIFSYSHNVFHSP